MLLLVLRRTRRLLCGLEIKEKLLRMERRDEENGESVEWLLV